MFLKLSRSNLPSPDTEKSLQLDSVTKSDPPKGILREKTYDAIQKKAEIILGRAKQTPSFEEDKKSVRCDILFTSYLRATRKPITKNIKILSLLI